MAKRFDYIPCKHLTLGTVALRRAPFISLINEGDIIEDENKEFFIATSDAIRVGSINRDAIKVLEGLGFVEEQPIIIATYPKRLMDYDAKDGWELEITTKETEDE